MELTPKTRTDDQPPAARPGHTRGAVIAVAAVLAAVSFALYLPSLSNHFVDYDDPHYVTGNRVVQQGLTWQGVRWAFTTTRFANWLPVTWLSHMLDCELYGLNAAGHHATSAALHALNAALLFLALRVMTGRFWPPAAVAALFAVHPMRVESVSWIAERKDVLCATFFMLALLAYARYCRRPTIGRYGLVFLCHALGLMSKTMLVTLPCLLLLLDFWPLRRAHAGASPEHGDESGEMPHYPPRGIAWLVIEKLPLVLLSVVSSAWTVVFQSSGGAMWGYRDLTLAQRVANAFVSVPRYLIKLVWPADLSAFYPHPGSWPALKVATAVGMVLMLTAVAAASYRRRPYVTVGWFWFLGMLVPVSGIIQVGLQSMADRYMYLPSIGLFVAVCWGVSDWLRERRGYAAPVAAATAVLLIGWSVATVKQQRHWENTLTLFRKALDADPENWLAHNMVGAVFAANGERAFEAGDTRTSTAFYQAAAAHTAKSLAAKPDHYPSLHNQAQNMLRLGRPDAAIDLYRKSIAVRPTWGYSQVYLGVALAQQGRLAEALPLFEEGVRLLPESTEAHLHLAEALLLLGRKEEAIKHLKQVLLIRPDHADAAFYLEQATKPSTAPATAPTTTAATAPAPTPVPAPSTSTTPRAAATPPAK